MMMMMSHLLRVIVEPLPLPPLLLFVVVVVVPPIGGIIILTSLLLADDDFSDTRLANDNLRSSSSCNFRYRIFTRFKTFTVRAAIPEIPPLGTVSLDT